MVYQHGNRGNHNKQIAPFDSLQDGQSTPTNQLWKTQNDGTIRSLWDDSKCVAAGFKPGGISKPLRVKACPRLTSLNQFVMESNSRIRLVKKPNFCLTAKGTQRVLHARPCKDRAEFEWKLVADNQVPDEDDTISLQATEWLTAHNKRRRDFHKKHNKKPVLLKWSDDVAKSATDYSKALVKRGKCELLHGYNGDRYGGENLALQIGRQASPDGGLSIWFEGERNLSFPANGHLTQVAWRATQYVGCGEAKLQLSNGSVYSNMPVFETREL